MKMSRETASDLADVMDVMGRRKWATARVKSTPTDGSGRFTAIVSTFGPPPDAQNDVIAEGAFLKSIASWRARGKRPALWWGHDYKNPSATIGIIDRMYEADAGLLIEATLDLDHEPAVAVYEGLLGGRLNEFSIGYAVVKEHKEKGYNVLDEVEILEVSVVYAGANRFTRVLEVKSAVPLSEIDRINAQLDELAKPGPLRKGVDPAEVDRFITAVRQQMVEEKLAEAEQAAWERRTDVNLVLDSVPVRVDARMRPVSGEDGSPSL